MHTITTFANGAKCAQTADLDGNGFLDIVSASTYDDRVSWYRNHGNGKFSSVNIISTNLSDPNSVHCKDIDNDSDLDILVSSESGIGLIKNLGHGNFSEPSILNTPSISDTFTYHSSEAVHSADFNGNGSIDIVGAYGSKDLLIAYINSGDGEFNEQLILYEGNSTHRRYLTDVKPAQLSGDEHELIISGGSDADHFLLNSLTGELNFKSPPDFENPSDLDQNNIYEVEIKITDVEGKYDTQHIKIEVLDQIDLPKFTSFNGSYSVVIQAEEYKKFVANLSASDYGFDNLSFSISGGIDQNLFEIDNSSGQLSFKANPKFNTPADSNGDNNYEVTVKLSDTSNLQEYDYQDFCIKLIASRTASLKDNFFHISPSGSDTSGDGTLANPYATIQKAIGHSSENGIIYLLPGTYQGSGNRNLSVIAKVSD
jgi:hypothetical protein